MKTKIKELINQNELEIARLQLEMNVCAKLGYCHQESAFGIKLAYLRASNKKLNSLLQ